MGAPKAILIRILFGAVVSVPTRGHLKRPVGPRL